MKDIINFPQQKDKFDLWIERFAKKRQNLQISHFEELHALGIDTYIDGNSVIRVKSGQIVSEDRQKVVKAMQKKRKELMSLF